MKGPEALYLFHEGNYFKSYEYLGAHPSDGGYIFRLWAPNARAVSVVGDFNNWNPEVNPMTRLEHSNGVWELDIPDIKVGYL